MFAEEKIDTFLSPYGEQVSKHALLLRKVVLANLPNVIEQIDLPAKLIGYCYGQKYSELVCVIIPSKKELKLGFNQGATLPDPNVLLKGTGKISRYVVIQSEKDIKSVALKKLIISGYQAYKVRMMAKG